MVTVLLAPQCDIQCLPLCGLSLPTPQRIMEAVDVDELCYEDLLLLLAHSSPEDINQCHKGGRAPMHVVCARGHIVALQLLLWVSCGVRACVV